MMAKTMDIFRGWLVIKLAQQQMIQRQTLKRTVFTIMHVPHCLSAWCYVCRFSKLTFYPEACAMQ
jgi:hypothetical protein